MSNYYTAREKELILMVHVHMKKEYERLNTLVKIIRKNKLFYSTFSTEDKLQMEELFKNYTLPTLTTAKIFDVGERSIRRWQSLKKTRDSLERLEHTGRPKKSFPEWAHISIRNIVQRMYSSNTFEHIWRCVSVEKVRSEFYKIHPPSDESVTFNGIPLIACSSFRKEMKNVGFKWVKVQGHPTIIRREDIAAEQTHYIEDLRSCISRKKKIFYTDETWCNVSLHTKKQPPPKDTTFAGESCAEAHTAGGGGSIGSTTPSRIIVCHVMSPHGLVNGAEFIFEEGKTKKMDSFLYEEWIREKVLPNLPDSCVLVMDKASYHNRLTEASKKPRNSWRKDDVITWLIERGEMYDEIAKESMCLLLERCKKYCIQQRYMVNQILAEKGIHVIRVPTKHYEYNPIELVWAHVKKYVAFKRCETHIGEDIIRLVREGLSTVSPEFCKNSVQHCLRILDRATGAEQMIESKIYPVLIRSEHDEEEDEEDAFPLAMERGVHAREPCAETPEELEQLERAIYSCTKAYSGVTKCQCRRRAPLAILGNCQNCSCSKSNIKCSEGCGCNPEACRNRNKADDNHPMEVDGNNRGDYNMPFNHINITDILRDLGKIEPKPQTGKVSSTKAKILVDFHTVDTINPLINPMHQVKFNMQNVVQQFQPSSHIHSDAAVAEQKYNLEQRTAAKYGAQPHPSDVYHVTEDRTLDGYPAKKFRTS